MSTGAVHALKGIAVGIFGLSLSLFSIAASPWSFIGIIVTLLGMITALDTQEEEQRSTPKASLA